MNTEETTLPVTEEVVEVVEEPKLTLKEMKSLIKGMYPDAFAFKWASRSICIKSPLLDKRLSNFFATEEEAWESAVEWTKRVYVKGPIAAYSKKSKNNYFRTANVV